MIHVVLCANEYTLFLGRTSCLIPFIFHRRIRCVFVSILDIAVNECCINVFTNLNVNRLKNTKKVNIYITERQRSAKTPNQPCSLAGDEKTRPPTGERSRRQTDMETKKVAMLGRLSSIMQQKITLMQVIGLELPGKKSPFASRYREFVRRFRNGFYSLRGVLLRLLPDMVAEKNVTRKPLSK